MNKSRFVVIGMVGISLSLAAQVKIVVSPEGSTKAPGTLEQAVSLQAAKELVRGYIRDQKSDIEVLLRGGTYQLEKTLVFGVEDGGTGDQMVSWKAYPGEYPVLTSGKKVDGWTKVRRLPDGFPRVSRGNLWTAPIPDNTGLFRAMFKGGEMLPRSRGEGFLPEIDAFNRDGKGHLRSRTRLFYPEVAMVRDWENITDIEIAIRPFALWVFNILPLQSVDEENNVLTTSVEGTYFLTRERYNRFGKESVWIENIPEGMTVPGNWCVNTLEGKIYYWPADGKEPVDVYVPGLCEYIRIEGKNTDHLTGDVPVRNLSISGLTMIHGDRDRWNSDDWSVQHDWELYDKGNAYIRLRGAENCRIEACELRSGANAGIRLDLFARGNSISNNCIHHLGGSGIVLCGYGPGMKDVNLNNEVVNNCLHDLGQIWFHNRGILVSQSGFNRIVHNLIFNMPYNGMAFVGSRAYFFHKEFRKAAIRGSLEATDYSFTDSTTNAVALSLREISSVRWEELGELHDFYTPKGEVGRNEIFDLVSPFLHSRSTLIEYNEIHDVMQVLGDGNAIYISDTGPYNVIRRNYIHHMENVFGVAIRTDAAQRETQVSGNLVYKCTGGLAVSNNNQAFHNVLIKCGGSPFSEIGESGSFHGNVYWDMSLAGGFGDGIIQRNVAYHDGSEAPNFSFNDQAKSSKRQLIDYNLFWWPGHELQLETQIDGHRDEAYDMHSLLEDPLFVDLEDEDFRFREESPARKLGIPSPEQEYMGLRPDFPQRFRLW